MAALSEDDMRLIDQLASRAPRGKGSGVFCFSFSMDSVEQAIACRERFLDGQTMAFFETVPSQNVCNLTVMRESRLDTDSFEHLLGSVLQKSGDIRELYSGWSFVQYV